MRASDGDEAGSVNTTDKVTHPTALSKFIVHVAEPWIPILSSMPPQVRFLDAASPPLLSGRCLGTINKEIPCVWG